MGLAMFKKLLIGLAILAGLAGPVYGAGTIPISLTQRFDNNTHIPLSGGLIYFIQAGTTATPQNAYQDSALTIPYANPLTLDSGGNIPQLFFADGQIKIRITNGAGVTQVVQDNILVIGPSSGGGGGGTVDPTTVLATGDFKLVYNTGVLSGFVRCNAKTIGNATSGATERANADTSALFSFLWTNDANLAVSGGRGANAAADYAANKTIALPDCRGRTLAALTDMGNSDSGRISTTYFGCTGLVLGCAGGSENTTLTASQIPSITSTVSTVTTETNILKGAVQSNTFNFSPGGGSILAAITSNSLTAGSSAATGNATSNNTSGAAHRTVQPTILVTTYIKL